MMAHSALAADISTLNFVTMPQTPTLVATAHLNPTLKFVPLLCMLCYAMLCHAGKCSNKTDLFAVGENIV